MSRFAPFLLLPLLLSPAHGQDGQAVPTPSPSTGEHHGSPSSAERISGPMPICAPMEKGATVAKTAENMQRWMRDAKERGYVSFLVEGSILCAW